MCLTTSVCRPQHAQEAAVQVRVVLTLICESYHTVVGFLLLCMHVRSARTMQLKVQPPQDERLSMAGLTSRTDVESSGPVRTLSFHPAAVTLSHLMPAWVTQRT